MNPGVKGNLGKALLKKNWKERCFTPEVIPSDLHDPRSGSDILTMVNAAHSDMCVCLFFEVYVVFDQEKDTDIIDIFHSVV